MTLPSLPLQDPDQAEQLATHSLVIAASAGSGKTFSLVTLVLAALGEGLRAFDIWATTFGREAASDMKRRLLSPLDQLSTLDLDAWNEGLAALGEAEQTGHYKAWEGWATRRALRPEIAQAARQWRKGKTPWIDTAENAHRHWVQVRREAENMRVCTVHALAMTLLQGQRDFQGTLMEADHPTLLRLLRRAGRESLHLPPDHPDHLAAQALLAWCEGREGDEARWPLLSARLDAHADALGTWRQDLDTTPCREAFWQDSHTVLAAYGGYLDKPEHAAAITKKGTRHKSFERYQSAAKFTPECGPDATPQDLWESVARLADRFLTAEGHVANYYAEAFREALTPLGESLPNALEAWMSRLLEKVFQAFQALKTQEKLYTYGDLVRQAWETLQANPLLYPPKLLLVDEYQDINPVQEAFLQGLRSLRTILVGDPKQAIYGFRGGVASLLTQRIASPGEGWLAFRLPDNHRSSGPVVQCANAFVENIMPALAPDSADPDGVQGHRPSHPTDTLVALAVGETAKKGADLANLHPWVGALSQETAWQDAGFASRPGKRTRALLLSRRTGLSALRAQLQKKHVDVLMQSQEGFWESPGVRLLIALLKALVHPHDKVSQLALLRADFVGLGDNALDAWLHAPEQLPDQVKTSIQQHLAWLDSLRTMNTQAALAQAAKHPGLSRTVHACRAHGAMEVLRAKRNLDQFLSRALALPTNLALAYAQLQAWREQADPGDAPSESEDAALIIQTVHGCKGLEYDDVILPLLHCQPKGLRQGSLATPTLEAPHVEMGWKLGKAKGKTLARIGEEEKKRAFEESLRLLYVGLTRAKDRMVLLQQWQQDMEGVAQRPASATEQLDKKKIPTWANVAETLISCHPLPQAVLPACACTKPITEPAPFSLEAPSPLPTLATRELALPHSSARMQQGIQLHALLREILAREENARQAYLERHPLCRRWPEAHGLVMRFMKAFEARGLAHFPRRLEFPLGSAGRADLIVWEKDRQSPHTLHMLDFKYAKQIGPDLLAAYEMQLSRYAQALCLLHPKTPIKTWLVPLEAEEWVAVGT